MPRLTNFTEANQALLPFVPLVGQLTGKDTTLERIRPLMSRLGDPQNNVRVVHIAGTSGKTSTAYFVSALLTAAGKKIGLTVSPHVDSVAERVQLNGKPLDEAKFCAYLDEFLDIVEQMPAKPSYFELLYAFSFWVFGREAVDYAVVETGMGGLFDATNVATRADKLCLITDIGFDHMHILGNTIPEIAAQKAGIIHEHNPVIMYRQSSAVNRVVEQQVAAMHAELHVINEEDERGRPASFASGMPAYQQRNWSLAQAAYRFLAQRDGLPELSDEQLLVSQQLQVPARMDRRQIGGKTIVMDGAHNGQKMQTFLTSFRQLYPNVRPAVLLALKEGKEPADVAPLLAPLASRVIITAFQTSQDLPARSINPERLALIFKAAGAADVQAIADMSAAYRQLLAGPEAACIITGSFYLLSQIRESEHLL